MYHIYNISVIYILNHFYFICIINLYVFFISCILFLFKNIYIIYIVYIIYLIEICILYLLLYFFYFIYCIHNLKIDNI